MGKSLKVVLSIAGSDSSGGAGIQADIKTIAAHGLFAETAVTALTAQNTTGVTGVLEAGSAFVAAQINAVFDDIRPDAVKVGMVSSADIICAIADRLRAYRAQNIVVDPVMVATSGSRLISEDAASALIDVLLPLADVVTPNMPEAQVLSGREVRTEAQMVEAGRAIAEMLTRNGCGPAVLVKGGHGEGDGRAEGKAVPSGHPDRMGSYGVCATQDVPDGTCLTRGAQSNDVLVFPDGTIEWIYGERVETENTHGTGCTLSSAIACGLAEGLPLIEAVARAKRYVAGALAAGLDLGRGSGPLDHMWQHR